MRGIMDHCGIKRVCPAGAARCLTSPETVPYSFNHPRNAAEQRRSMAGLTTSYGGESGLLNPVEKAFFLPGAAQ